MTSRRSTVALMVAALGLGMIVAAPASRRPAAPREAGAGLRAPMSFEPNRGHVDGRVDFLARGSGYTAFLTSGDAVLALRPSGSLTMRLVGRAGGVRAEGVKQLPGVVNSYVGSDPARWHATIPTYAAVKYAGVYEGIDLLYYGEGRSLEHDFVVHPNTDPRAIALAFDGADAVELDSRGDLVLRVDEGDVRLRSPRIYQEGRSVDGGYVIRGDRVGFRVGRYDRSLPLVIDPVLEFSTYLGGSAADVGADVALDDAGNAYVTGSTASTNFPPSPVLPAAGGTDVFVTKVAADGSGPLWSTYLGGSATDDGHGIAVEPITATPRTYVTGNTRSANFPANAIDTSYNGGGGGDAFLTRLSFTGMLDLSTFLGGTGDDTGWDVTSFGSVAGSTSSADFPVTGGTYGGNRDAFFVALNATGTAFSLARWVGGSGLEDGFAVAGNTIAGQTCSTNFPVTANVFQASAQGACDGFVATVGNAGVTYGTYIGGSNWDLARGLVSLSGRLAVVGSTRSANFPTKASAFQTAFGGGTQDVFVSVLEPTAAGSNELVASSFLGGAGDEFGSAAAVDAAGAIYVTGSTTSADFDLENPLPGEETFGGGAGVGDAFVTRFKPGLPGLLYSTFLGGAGEEGGSGIALDSLGRAYVAGTTNAPFPAVNALQPAPGGGSDAFLAKIAPSAPGTSNVGPFAYLGTSGSPITVIDTATRSIVGTVAVPSFQHSTAVSPDGTRIYVTNREDASLSVINRNPATNAHAVVQTVAVGGSPQGVAVSPDGMRVYVMNRVEDSVSVIAFDPSTNTHSVIATPLVSDGPHGIAVNPNGKFVYTANRNNDTMSIIDTATNQAVVLMLPVGDQPYGIAVRPDGNRIYTMDGGDDTMSVVEYDAGANTHTKIASVPLFADPGTDPVAVNPEGTRAYGPAGETTQVVDTAANSLVDTIQVPGHNGVAVTPDGKWLYAASFGYATVVDLQTKQTEEIFLGVSTDFNGLFIGPPDVDKDGIIDPIDTSAASSDAFSDTSKPGGTLQGSITDRGGLDVFVWDALNPEGVYARAAGGAGTATLDACGMAVQLTAGDVTKLVGCGSLTLESLAGRVDVPLTQGAVLALQRGATAKVTEGPPDIFRIDNPSTVPLQILDPSNAVLLTIAPGTFATWPSGPTGTTQPTAVPGANTPPVFSNCTGAVAAPVFGDPTVVTLTASDADPRQTIRFTPGGAARFYPANVTQSPGNPATATLRFTPTLLDWLFEFFGWNFDVTITATDSGSPPLSATCALDVNLLLFAGSAF